MKNPSKQLGRPKDERPKVEGSTMILRVNTFIPGYEPEDFTIKVKGFMGSTFGRARRPESVKQEVIKALKGVYGGMIE